MSKPLPPDPQLPILVYQTEDGLIRVDVHMEANTVWLNQNQLAELFDTSRPNITQHIRNVFAEGELIEQAVGKDFLRTAANGKQYNTRHYNKGAMNCAPTPHIVGAQFIAPNCAMINLRGVHYKN